MTKPRITIIGLGQRGASMGLALKKAGAEIEIVGHDKQRDVMQQTAKLGAVDKTEWNLYNACENAGMIVLAMPLDGVLETIKLIKDDIVPGVIVTDMASIKLPVLEAAREFKPGVHFIGGHPIFRPKLNEPAADSAPNADLYVNAVYCLAPTPTSDSEAIQVVSNLVAMLGANPLFTDAAEHDGLVAGAQDLAYVLSAVLLKTTTASSGWRELNRFAGNDYAQATELAAHDPTTQRELMLAQRDHLQRWIDSTIQTLRELRGLLAQNDAGALDEWYSSMLDAREHWLAGDVGAQAGPDLSELRSSTARMFLGGLATRGGRDKKK